MKSVGELNTEKTPLIHWCFQQERKKEVEFPARARSENTTKENKNGGEKKYFCWRFGIKCSKGSEEIEPFVDKWSQWIIYVRLLKKTPVYFVTFRIVYCFIACDLNSNRRTSFKATRRVQEGFASSLMEASAPVPVAMWQQHTIISLLYLRAGNVDPWRY